MRVAFVSFDFGEYSLRVAGALAAYGETMLALPITEAEPHMALLNPQLHFRPFVKPRLRNCIAQIRTIASLIQSVKSFKPHVVHLQSGHLWFNLAVGFLRPCPLVVTVHDVVRHPGDLDARRTPQWVWDRGYRSAKRLIVHAPQLRDLLISRLGVQPARVHVVPHVLCGEASTNLDVREEPCEVLFFGRIWGYKGLEYLIRAEPLITAQAPQCKIVIAGTGEDMAKYKRMMVHPERFELRNEYVSHQVRAMLFRRASVVVLPYTEASQSGVVPIAYMHGKPVVATSVGGLPAIVEDGVTGFLVPPRDARALADRVITLLRNESLRRRMGASGKLKLETECSPEVVAQKTLCVYREAIEAQ